MPTLRADLAYAVRSWRRSKVAVAAAVLALGLGIGATTTMFSVMSGVILKPLPYPAGDRLVMVWQDGSARGRRDWVSPGLYAEWAARSTTLEHFGAVRGWQPNLTGVAEPERLRGVAVSAGYFEALGIAPLVGRVFTASEDTPGGPPVVVLSHGLWTRRFGADRALVGTTIVLDGVATEVLGVMPESFVPAVVESDAWSPIRIDPAAAPRAIITLRVLARLKPDVPLAQARAEMATMALTLRREDEEWERLGISVIPLAEDLVGPIAPTLYVLSGAVVAVLLIACANVTSLLLARATDRAREMAIRAVLGASRGRLIRQLLSESLALAGVGGLFGLALAVVGVRLCVALAPPGSPRLADIGVDGGVLAFTALLTLTTAVVAGLTPALAATRGSLNSSLRDGARGVTAGARLRSVLVALEVAAAMVLAVGAGLLIRSLASLQAVDLGFDASGVMTASVSPPRTAYDSDEKLRSLYTSILERAASSPGVGGVALVSVLPLSGMSIIINFSIEGRERPTSPNDAPTAGVRNVSSDYFRVMGIRVLEGRTFTHSDRPGAEHVAIVNQVLASRYWPDTSPIGQRVYLQGSDATIVGVVGNVRHAGPGAAADGELYVPLLQAAGPGRGAWIVARTDRSMATTAASIRSAVRNVDPNLPLAQAVPLDELLSRVLAPSRFVTAVLSAFSALATTLALVGIYSVLSFAVSRRTRDISVRMALGASRPAVVRMILRQSLTVVLAGIVAGAVIAASLSRFLQTLLFDVQAGDPWTIAWTGALIVSAGALASYAPACRAARIDPLAALRDD